MNLAALLKHYREQLTWKLAPVEENTILFTSFGGHYSDNPKYISQAVHRLYPDKKIIWLVKPQYAADLPDYVTGVDIDSPEADHWRTTAGIVVDNVYGGREYYLTSDALPRRAQFRLEAFLKDKPAQKVFTTWHGTPLKRMGRDQLGSVIRDFACLNTTMVMGNRYTLDIMEHLTFGKIPMKLLGTPRNDILFQADQLQASLKQKLGLPADKKILLFAPTFRSDSANTADTNIHRSGLDQLEQMDAQKLFSALSSRFGGDWVMVCRFHYHVEAQVDWDVLEQKYPGRFLNGNLHDDMAEYLCCADALLTDASSSMYDYALTGRPCLLFFPDLGHYASQERGFYTPIEDLPFPAAVQFPQLLDAIETFDQSAYDAAVQKMLTDYGFVDDADSSERIVKLIFAGSDDA